VRVIRGMDVEGGRRVRARRAEREKAERGAPTEVLMTPIAAFNQHEKCFLCHSALHCANIIVYARQQD
jgi:hypothetical protein